MRLYLGFLLLFLCPCLPCRAGTPVETNPQARMSVLGAIFPGSKIQVSRRRIVQHSRSEPGEFFDWPDAFAAEPIYSVKAPPIGDTELCAAGDVSIYGQVGAAGSDTRELRFKVYRWHRSDGAEMVYVAVAQYAFVGASPAGACWSVGKVALVSKRGNDWKIDQEVEFDTQHHTTIPSIRFADVDGDGTDELLIESDWGGACAYGSSIHIFDLSTGKLRELTSEPTRYSNCIDGMTEYMQRLDLSRTVREHGRRFCFHKISRAEADRVLYPYRVTDPCYEPNEGDAK